MNRLKSPAQRRRDTVLPPVHPNVGVRVAYERRLTSMIDDMHASLRYWLLSAYKNRPTYLAQDLSPFSALEKTIRNLAKRWVQRFSEVAEGMARYFVTQSHTRTEESLKQHLRQAGMTVPFELSPAAKEAFSAVVKDNVGLIKGLAEQHMHKVEGLVMRSVSTGRDLHVLAKGLQEEYGITKRRAAMIARDQNNKATAVITKVRQQELGLTKAIWMHSGAGKHPRPEHVAASKGKLVYDVQKGAYLEGRWTWPGHEINCRCVSRTIVPGFE